MWKQYSHLTAHYSNFFIIHLSFIFCKYHIYYVFFFLRIPSMYRMAYDHALFQHSSVPKTPSWFFPLSPLLHSPLSPISAAHMNMVVGLYRRMNILSVLPQVYEVSSQFWVFSTSSTFINNKSQIWVFNILYFSYAYETFLHGFRSQNDSLYIPYI